GGVGGGRVCGPWLRRGSHVRRPGAGAWGWEMLMPPPAAADVRGVIRAPRARAEPRVPVDFLARWLGLFRQPGMTHLGGVPGRDVSADRMDLPQPARTRQLDRGHKVRLAQPLHSSLVNA